LLSLISFLFGYYRTPTEPQDDLSGKE